MKKIGEFYDVIVAETTSGELEKEKAKLVKIDFYKNKKIFVFEPEYPNTDCWVSYDEMDEKNIDWDFISELYDYYNNFPTF